jgi:anti-anti-sigma regulatory factor
VFSVRSDPDRNRLYLTMAGHLDGAERQVVTKALMAEAAKLQPGFDIVSDISALHATDEAGFKDLLRAKAALKLKGSGRVVRVVKIPLSRIQITRVSEAAGYDSDCVDSVEEADRLLDELRAGTKTGS